MGVSFFDATVLIVDDSVIIRRHLSGILKRAGVRNIHFAEDGASAIHATKARAFNLILLDWNMPKLTGLDVLRLLRSLPATRETPIIMVTGEALRENIIAALQSGATDYVVKPYTEELVLKKAHAALNPKVPS
ncbi:MAG: response regulator [Nitrospinae bacterium]|nr:response regulator [Nitrospinota bacterium]